MLQQVTEVLPVSVFEQRLRNLIVALRESPAPDAFTMKYYGYIGRNPWWDLPLPKDYQESVQTQYPCKTPACVLGHYAARQDLQDVFKLTQCGTLDYGCNFSFYTVLYQHFGLSDKECDELFGSYGCGRAHTTGEAITYIEQFITRKFPAV